MRTKGYYVDGHDRDDVLENRKGWLKRELELELRQYLWMQMPLEEAKEMNTGGDEAECLRLLLCDDDSVDDIGDNDDSNGVNKEKNGVVSDRDIQNSMRSEMIFKYDKVVDGSKQRWVELHVDLLSPEARRECATVVNG